MPIYWKIENVFIKKNFLKIFCLKFDQKSWNNILFIFNPPAW